MKLIGIVGGIGPESTIDYYRLFVSIYRERRPGGGYPAVVINSIDLSRVLKLLDSNDLGGRAAIARKLKRLGLFGTRYTMRGGFYQKVFALEGMEIEVPGQADGEFIHETYLNELVNGIVLAKTRERYIDIARRMKREQGIDGLILGGTELPLLLRDASGIGVPLLATARLHVEAAVSELLSDEAR